MQTVTVKQVQSTLPDLLRLVARGQAIRVTQRKPTVARILPAGNGRSPVDWADT